MNMPNDVKDCDDDDNNGITTSTATKHTTTSSINSSIPEQAPTSNYAMRAETLEEDEEEINHCEIAQKVA